MGDELTIRQIPASQAPWDLLLLADPSRSHIETYLAQGSCYLATRTEIAVGVLVLSQTGPDTMEIMNIAVAEACQGQGIGKQLIAAAKAIAREHHAARLEVGTGNSSIDELAFYQKAGFRIVGVDRDFFRRNYDQEIIENGIRCIDMIRLAMDL